MIGKQITWRGRTEKLAVVALLFVTALSGMLESSFVAAETVSAKPNVLFIAVDDLRPELGCYDHTWIKSPNIDKLAERGMVFNRAYCQVPTCGASRASLFTSLRPTPKRFRNFDTSVDKDAPGAITLPEEFKNNGYHCISNGKIFHNKEIKRLQTELDKWLKAQGDDPGKTETEAVAGRNAKRAKGGKSAMGELPTGD